MLFKFAIRSVKTACICLLSLLILVACSPISPNLAQRSAQPKVPPARNFTSFSASLRCMDDLLLGAKRSRVLISSTGLPDRTKKLNVGTDDMLLNAINQMNRKSKTYIFIDQSLEKLNGQIAIHTPRKGTIDPQLYIRGAITQIDSNVASSTLTLETDDPDRITDHEIGRGLTVVTVDMHLVNFNTKAVISGSSVANSMVVTTKGFGVGTSGMIDVTAFNTKLRINRVESLGQAVRNLVELGAIELIGRHANVAYWECLNIPAVKQRRTNRKEIVFSSADKILRIPEVQGMLATLGFYSGDTTGVLDPRTRDAISHFQAQHGLIATGDLNYDTFQHLLERTRGFAPKRRTDLPTKPQYQIEIVKDIVDEPALPRPAKIQRRPIQIRLFGKSKPMTLDLKSVKNKYTVGDVWQSYLVAPRGGFLSCFHQSDGGPITQILPVQSNASFAVGEGQEVEIPNPEASFDIKFETKGTREKVLCILEIAEVPMNLDKIASNSDLGPMKVTKFEAIIDFYKAKNKNIMWGQISESG